MYAKLGVGLVIIAQIFCFTIGADDARNLVSDYIAMEEALNQSKISTTNLNSAVETSHTAYTADYSIQLDGIVTAVSELGVNIAAIQIEVEMFHNITHTAFDNLTAEGVSLQRELLKIQIDLGDWTSLTEDIEKYEQTWVELPVVYESQINSTRSAYLALTYNISAAIEDESEEDQKKIEDLIYNLKKDLVIQVGILTSALNKAEEDAYLLISATKQYLTNFETRNKEIS